MQIEFNQPVQGYDLAQLLQENQGTFLAEQAGQSYIVCAEPGHSISFGPKPIGKPRVSVNTIGIAEPWTVTKLSDQSLARELTQQSSLQGSTEMRRRQVA